MNVIFLAFAAFAANDASIKLLERRIDPSEVAFIGALLGFAALPFVRRKGERIIDLITTKQPKQWLRRPGMRTIGIGHIAASGLVTWVRERIRLPARWR